MRRPLALSLFALAACYGEGTDPESTDGPEDGGPGDIDAPPADAAPLDGLPNGNAGFVIPTAVTKANTFTGGAWTEVGDADWTCLNTPSDDQPSTGTIALTGRVGDFQTGNGVGDATVTAWSTGPSATVGTATTDTAAATRGNFTMTLGMLPAGTRRYGFTITAPQFVTTKVLGRFYAPGVPATDDLEAISQSTATALPAFIGITRDPSKGLLIGSLHDCQGRAVSNAVVGVSALGEVFADAGGETFYFSAGGSSLPVRHNVAPVMNKDGLYAVLNVPPPGGMLQVWGFRTVAELSAGNLVLLAQTAAPVLADEVVVADLEARRN
jgi:hypothetical protein